MRKLTGLASQTRGLLQERPFPTPFGEVKLPELKPPKLRPLRLDQKQQDVVMATLGGDLALVVGLIPLVGDLAENTLRAWHEERVRELLTPEEFGRFFRWKKMGPATVAALRVFMGE